MHLAEPLTPHTVSRSTNRKLRHCEFTWVHLDQKIVLAWEEAASKFTVRKDRKCICREVETPHLYKYCHYKTK